MLRSSPKTEIEKGSAPAPGAVFRALAENNGRAEKFRFVRLYSCPKRLDARRVQQRPRRACSPEQVFSFNRFPCRWRLAFCLALLCLVTGMSLIAGAVAAVNPGGDQPHRRTLYVSKLGDNSDGLSWAKAFRTIQAALDAVPDDHGGNLTPAPAPTPTPSPPAK